MSVDGMDGHLRHADKASDYLNGSRLDGHHARCSKHGAEVEDNLTVRGLVFRLGEGAYGCFDTELLRWSVVWTGFSELPEHGHAVLFPTRSQECRWANSPSSKRLSVTGLYPGIFSGNPGWTIRETVDSILEIWGGAHWSGQGVWKAVGSSAGGNWLSYQIGSTSLRSRGDAGPGWKGRLVRSLEVGPHSGRFTWSWPSSTKSV